MVETYVITGANRGIGLEMAREALAKKIRTIAICRNPEGLDALNSLKIKYGPLCEVAFADVCDAPSLDRVATKIEGVVDAIICNAGVMSVRGGINDEGNTIDSIQSVMLTNMVGPFFTTRAFLEPLSGSVKPRVAVISSFMGSQQHTGSSAYFYRASKAGANTLMVTMSNELRPRGIAVAAYHPGWVKTGMGGQDADLTPQKSASALIARFQELDMSKSGRFINYDGEYLPL
jgi:NAD(P)-dependent dehydrogenase (short-subunit alcohol dehydrogenase family)